MADEDEGRRRALATFLRDRRACLDPAEHGFAGDRPRRVPEGFDGPAYATDDRFDVLACNGAAAALLPGLADPGANVMRLAFTDPRWRERVVDWAGEAARHVALYRAAMGARVADPAWAALPAELAAASPDFAALWERSAVAGPERGPTRFRDAGGTERGYHVLTLHVDGAPGVRLVVLR